MGYDRLPPRRGSLSDVEVLGLGVLIAGPDPEPGSVRTPDVFAKLTNNPGGVRFADRPLNADRESILREWPGVERASA